MSKEQAGRVRQAHRVLASIPFEPRRLTKGYADRWLRIDVGKNLIEIRPTTPQMKDLWVGGKGFDLWLTFQEVSKQTRWDSPENPICFSPGPLGGTTSFPGSGKTLVTAISPATGSMIDCNVGGFFGPYLKFAGFDALMLTGNAPLETIVLIDAVRGSISLESAPLEALDSHVLAEELTEAYADDELDRRNVAVVSAGQAAIHSRMGILNFSFYDWRRRVPRLKQAGRGGIGTVFRHKKLKALVIKSQGITRAWRISATKAEKAVASRISGCAESDGPSRDEIRAVLGTFGGCPERVLEMLGALQAKFGHVTRIGLEELCQATGIPMGRLYHMASFYPAVTLCPGPKKGADKALLGQAASMAARQLLGERKAGAVLPEEPLSFLAPGTDAAVRKLLTRKKKPERMTTGDLLRALAAPRPRPEPGPAGDPESLCRRAHLLAQESCGTCVPCREGLHAIDRVFERIRTGPQGPIAEVAEWGPFVKEICETIGAACLCEYGRSAADWAARAVDAFAAAAEVK